jgi:hypothetical protein
LDELVLSESDFEVGHAEQYAWVHVSGLRGHETQWLLVDHLVALDATACIFQRRRRSLIHVPSGKRCLTADYRRLDDCFLDGCHLDLLQWRLRVDTPYGGGPEFAIPRMQRIQCDQLPPGKGDQHWRQRPGPTRPVEEVELWSSDQRAALDKRLWTILSACSPLLAPLVTLVADYWVVHTPIPLDLHLDS